MTHDERRARAIAVTIFPGIPWEQLLEVEKGACRKAATASSQSDDAAGFVLVPVNPTGPMLKAGYDAVEDGCPPDQIWRSMIANRPHQDAVPLHDAATGGDDADV